MPLERPAWVPQKGDVPNCLFYSSNEWGIPTLDMASQADYLDVPVEAWGAKSRALLHTGTVHAYVDDYRFTALWKDPSKMVACGCLNVVELNFTVSLQSPRAYVMWVTYQKRWLSTYWASQGLKILVDMNVPYDLQDINLIGVPEGWKSYASRGYSNRIPALQNEYERAREHAGGDVLFMVYGGGVAVRDVCRGLPGSIWVPECSDVKKGKYGDGPVVTETSRVEQRVQQGVGTCL